MTLPPIVTSPRIDDGYPRHGRANSGAVHGLGSPRKGDQGILMSYALQSGGEKSWPSSQPKHAASWPSSPAHMDATAAEKTTGGFSMLPQISPRLLLSMPGSRQASKPESVDESTTVVGTKSPTSEVKSPIDGTAAELNEFCDACLDRIVTRIAKNVDIGRRQKTADAYSSLARSTRIPGDWNAKLYCSLRQQFLEDGSLDAISGLTAAAAQASCAALEAGEYRMPPALKNKVTIPNRDHIQWFGVENMPQAHIPMDAKDAPPLICTSMRMLDAASALKRLYPDHAVCASFDATDFSTDGRALLGCKKSRSLAQQELFLRTSFEYSNCKAPVFCQRTTMQEQLMAESDPFAFAASDVTMFRGPGEEGYPFLAEDQNATFSLIVVSRANSRPMMIFKSGEYFAMQEDLMYTIDRFNLIANCAITLANQDNHALTSGASTGDDGHGEGTRKPLLVISLQDVCLAGKPQQPRQSLATILKSWRLEHAHMFEAVIVACGDEETAAIMDKTVNASIYASALTGSAEVTLAWSWDEKLLALSVNRVLLKVADIVASIRCANLMGGTAVSSGARRDSFGRRRSSVELAVSNAAAVSEANAGCKYVASKPTQVWQGARRPSIEVAHDSVPRADAGPEQRTGKSAVHPEDSTTSSRAAFERSLQTRLEESGAPGHDVLSQKKYAYAAPESELQANAGVMRAKAVNAFMKVRNKSIRHKAKKGAPMRRNSLSEKDVPKDVRQAIHVQEEVKVAREEVQAGRESELLHSVQNLASAIGARLQGRPASKDES